MEWQVHVGCRTSMLSRMNAADIQVGKLIVNRHSPALNMPVQGQQDHRTYLGGRGSSEIPKWTGKEREGGTKYLWKGNRRVVARRDCPLGISGMSVIPSPVSLPKLPEIASHKQRGLGTTYLQCLQVIPFLGHMHAPIQGRNQVVHGCHLALPFY